MKRFGIRLGVVGNKHQLVKKGKGLYSHFQLISCFLFERKFFNQVKRRDVIIEHYNSKCDDDEVLINRIEICIRKANGFKNNEVQFKECLKELKKYMSRLDERKGILLSETSWNYLIQHFSKVEEFEEMAIIYYMKIIREKKIVLGNSFTLGNIMRVLSCRGELELCEEIIDILKQRNECSLYSYSNYVNACIKRDKLQKAMETIFEMKRNGVEPNYLIFIAMLKAATASKNLELGQQILQLIYQANSVSIQVSMSILTFSLELKRPEIAILECERLEHRGLMNLVSWTCLMKAYIQTNNVKKAIELLYEMISHDIKPDTTCFSILISACANSRLLEEGEALKETSIQQFESLRPEIQSSMMSLYFKCEKPEKVIEISDKTKDKRKTTQYYWSCLMMVHTQKGDVEKVVDFLYEMIEYGITLNSTHFTILISSCANKSLFEIGRHLHQLIIANNVEISGELAVALMNFYTKSGEPMLAIEEFKKFQKEGHKEVGIWNSLLQAFINLGEVEHAVDLIHEMQNNDVNPDRTTFLILITACGNHKLLELGENVLYMATQAFENPSTDMLTAIVRFYTKCGKPETAIKEFKQNRQAFVDNPSWTSVIQAYIKQGKVEQAIEIVFQMEQQALLPNSKIYSIIIASCADTDLFEKGEFIYRHSINQIGQKSDILNRIIHLYLKSNQPKKAIIECEEHQRKALLNIMGWNTLIQAYLMLDEIDKAVELLDEMQRYGSTPSSISYAIVLSTLSNKKLFEKGMDLILKAYHLIDAPLFNTILNFYLKCDKPEKVIEECEKYKDRFMNIQSRNSLVQAYCKMNQIETAFDLIKIMDKLGTKPDSSIFTTLITACANNNLKDIGEEIHSLAIEKIGNLPIELHNAIINFYSKVDDLERAFKEIEIIQRKKLMDVVSWTCLINLYAQQGEIDLAFQSFQQMKKEGVDPSVITFTLILCACGDFVSELKGASIIEDIRSRGLDSLEEISCAMLNFYSKIGDINSSVKLIGDIRNKNEEISLMTYNSLLSHYAKVGDGLKTKEIFQETVERNVKLDDHTFTLVLTSFSNGGMLEEAIHFYGEMARLYHHQPSIYNIATMVGIYSKAGLFEEAERLIGNQTNFILWNTLMGACQKSNNMEMAEKAFSKLSSIREREASPYLVMSQIYRHHGLIEKEEAVLQQMKLLGIKKVPGIVYLEDGDKTLKFISGSNKHSPGIDNETNQEKKRDIYQKIIRLGYKPDIKMVALPSQQEVLDSLSNHAEKKAIIHALALNPNREKILLTSSILICKDCHSFMQFVSRVENVEILIKDSSDIHYRFIQGKCTTF